MSANHTHYDEQSVYITRDGSSIRELMHPDQHASKNQSLAEAVVHPGEVTQAHYHNNSEELYYITQGEGEMHLGEQTFIVLAGDTVCIKPGTTHFIRNAGQTDLVFLCMCSPAYQHQDTYLVEG